MMENLLIFIAKLGVVASSIMIFLILLEYKNQYKKQKQRDREE